MSLTLPRIAILGAGSMGGAILAGLVRPEVDVESVTVTNRTTAKAAALASERVRSLATEENPQANLEAVRGSRIVLIGVKPAMVPALLDEIAPALEADAVVVSIAAAVTLATMEARVPGAVLRAMPNTPSFVGLGVTGLAAGSRSSDEDLALATALFETVGDVLVVPEERIDELSTISGSGPAYVFFLIEQLEATARRMGFSDDEATRMVQGTFRGAVELLAVSDVGPEELRRRVTSPNGTTERAIGVLQSADLGDVFDRATAAALARAKELAAG